MNPNAVSQEQFEQYMLNMDKPLESVDTGLEYAGDMVFDATEGMSPKTRATLGTIATVGPASLGAFGTLGKIIKDLTKRGHYANLPDVNKGGFGQSGGIYWQGSPSKYDRMDNSFIGTGEGSQYKGWGGYLAENKDVGQIYEDTVTHGYNKALKDSFTYKGENIGNFNDVNYWSPEQTAAMFKKEYGDKAEAALNHFGYKSAVEALHKADVKQIQAIPKPDKSPGYLYEYDVPDADVGKMLDLDAPAKGQGDTIEKLSLIVNKVGTDTGKLRQAALQRTGDSVRKLLEEQLDSSVPFRESTLLDISNAGISIPPNAETPEIVSKMLLSKGIPGSKFFDAFSRGGKKGTRNLVLFDDTLPKMLNRTSTSIGNK